MLLYTLLDKYASKKYEPLICPVMAQGAQLMFFDKDDFGNGFKWPTEIDMPLNKKKTIKLFGNENGQDTFNVKLPSIFFNSVVPLHNVSCCSLLNHTRKKFYKANSMKELFEKIALKNIINFLKIIGLLLKIYTMLPTLSTIKFIQTESFDLF